LRPTDGNYAWCATGAGIKFNEIGVIFITHPHSDHVAGLGPLMAVSISRAARNDVPAVYWASEFARDGGLLSYGPDPVDLYRRTASYVDRILRGATRRRSP
jgi:ribonuclease BN (tRNA processing enzyme)